VAGVYRPRHSERTVLYRVLFHYFDQFLAEYESRFERDYGFLRSIIKEVVERYLDCGNPRCGFARIRCPNCGEERPLLSLERLSLDEREGKVCYRYGEGTEEVERMDYLELETSPASRRLAGILLGLRGFNRLFFMIFYLTRQKSG